MMDVVTENPIPSVLTLIVLLFTAVFMCSGSPKKQPRDGIAEEEEEEEEEEDDGRDPLDVREGDELAPGNDGRKVPAAAAEEEEEEAPAK